MSIDVDCFTRGSGQDLNLMISVYLQVRLGPGYALAFGMRLMHGHVPSQTVHPSSRTGRLL